MRTATVLILLGLLGVSGVVVYYYERQAQLLKELTFQLISFNVIGASDDLVKTQFTMRIFSKSTLDANVNNLALDVYINGIKLATATSDPFVIPAIVKSTTPGVPDLPGYSDVAMKVDFSPKLLVGNLAGLLVGITSMQDFTIHIIGYVEIQEAFLRISVPVDYPTTLQQILKP
jgi:hypothetical protein